CPARKFLCVYDDEVLPNVGQAEDDGSCTFDKVVANGTTASVTAIFGFTLSGLVVKDIYSKLI
ncbi:MAG: tRNA threonylcarbamoyladenosine dehydratase, partial [Bacteroidales bacterium]|nr:tRNA threonylcarbamoyladenosine dehydratase [Bacteroidales bacterium]